VLCTRPWGKSRNSDYYHEEERYIERRERGAGPRGVSWVRQKNRGRLVKIERKQKLGVKMENRKERWVGKISQTERGYQEKKKNRGAERSA